MKLIQLTPALCLASLLALSGCDRGEVKGKIKTQSEETDEPTTDVGDYTEQKSEVDVPAEHAEHHHDHGQRHHAHDTGDQDSEVDTVPENE